MADKIKFIIPGKPEYLTMVRLALGSIADTAGFDLEEIEDIKTSVQELPGYRIPECRTGDLS